MSISPLADLVYSCVELVRLIEGMESLQPMDVIRESEEFEEFCDNLNYFVEERQ